MRVLYDDKNLYVGIDCEQIHSPIVRRLQRRDGSLPSDGVWIDIDSRNDGVSAYHFSVNAAGVAARRHPLQRHRLLGRLGRHLGGQGRHHRPRLQRRVPHPALQPALHRAAGRSPGAFRCGASSTPARRPTTGPSSRGSAASFVPYFGRLDDLVGLPPPGRFELRPFVLGKLEHRAAGADASSIEHGTFAHAVGRARRQGAPHQRADARPDGEPRLRPGRGRHRHPEPVDVRDVLPREAAVLPGGARRLRHHPPRPLHPPHRPPAGAADAERRRGAGRASPTRRPSTAPPRSRARSAAGPPWA